MLPRSPCELYLKYLIVKSRPYKYEEVAAIAQAERLDYLGKAFLMGLRVQLHPPRDFSPADRYHIPSQRFIDETHLRPLFFPDKAMQQARKILLAPRAKEFAETMILGGAPFADIARVLTNTLHVSCSAEGVLSFQRHFWNTDLLDTTEMRILLRMRGVAALPVKRGLRDPDTTARNEAYRAALKTAMYRDARFVAVDLPRSAASSAIAQMYVGGMTVADVEMGSVLPYLQRLAVFRIMEEAASNQQGAAKRAKDWSGTLRDLDEVARATVTPGAELQKQVQILRLKTNPASAPVSMKELTGGHHTTDFQPLPEPEEDDEIDGTAGSADAGTEE